MPANLLPRVSDSVFAAALIVQKELLFFNNVGFSVRVPSINTNTC